MVTVTIMYSKDSVVQKDSCYNTLNVVLEVHNQVDHSKGLIMSTCGETCLIHQRTIASLLKPQATTSHYCIAAVCSHGALVC